MGVLAAIVILLAVTGGDSAQETDLAQLKQPELESEKLRQEVQKLRDEQNTPFFLQPIAFTALTVLVAAGGLIVTLLGQGRESTRQSNADRAQRKEVEQRRKDEHQQAEQNRRADAERRQEERFAALAKALASESAGERVSALVGIEAFLEATPDYRARLFTLLRGILTVPWSATSDRAIARAFVRVLRRQIEENPTRARRLDLEDVHLRDVDLTGLALPEINGHGVNLTGACLNGASFERGTLTEAKLSRVRGNAATSFRRADLSGEETELTEAVLRDSILVETIFRGAKLSSAKLDGADCRGAAFVRAGLQNAHLNNAILIGTDFSRADVNDAFFEGATFNEPTLRSLLKAKHWEDANWDKGTLEELRRLAGAGDGTQEKRDGDQGQQKSEKKDQRADVPDPG